MQCFAKMWQSSSYLNKAYIRAKYIPVRNKVEFTMDYGKAKPARCGA